MLAVLGNNLVEGNYIGTDVTGTLARPNRTDGIWINSPGNIIGGSSTAARNVVSGNGWRGVMVNTAAGTVIQGNYIGVNASGLAALGNGITGLELFAAPESIVGGTSSGVRNVISGNAVRGILINGGSGSNVRGNFIGTNATGGAALPNNGAGLLIAASSGNVIGDAAAPNTIAFNSGPGIQVASGTGNAISVNAIFGNGGIGIDLGTDAVTANDAGDADDGANNLQNFPVLTSGRGRRAGHAQRASRTPRSGSSSSATRRATPPATARARRSSARTVVTTDATGNATDSVLRRRDRPVRDRDGDRWVEQHLRVLRVRPTAVPLQSPTWRSPRPTRPIRSSPARRSSTR